jgi:hypothetical protein
VKQFTQRIYQLPAAEFFSRHEELLTSLRQLLAPSQLDGMARQLLALGQPLLQGWQQQGKVCGGGGTDGSDAALAPALMLCAPAPHRWSSGVQAKASYLQLQARRCLARAFLPATA